MPDISATIVFEKTWDAIFCDIYRDENGQPILDEEGNHQRAIRYIIHEGSSRSSKTYSIIDAIDLYARQEFGKRCTIWRDTKIDCKDTVGADFKLRLQSTDRYEVEQSYHKTESIYTYANASTVELRGADETKKVHGLTQHVAWFNEPYKIDIQVFNQIDQRTADFIIIDWNPRESHWVDNLKKDPRAIVIKSTFRDNPFCPNESRLKILSYQPVKRCFLVESKAMTEQHAKLYDLVNNPEGYDPKHISELARCRLNEDKNSADDFNWSVYGLGEKAERPNRIFKWHPIGVEQYRAIDVKPVLGCDWGTVDPWGILECKYYDGALYLHELNYESENKWREKMTATERSQADAGGPDAADVGIVTWMFGKLGIGKDMVIVCDNNRPKKIAALRRSGWSYALPAAKGADSIVDGIDLLNNVKVYYTSCSTNLEYEQENYSRAVDRLGTVLEEPEDTNNHLMDPARYIAQYLQSIGVIKNL